jgi:queuine tRNA-ribosyltransferase
MTLTYPHFSFKIHYQDAHSHARLGALATPHGMVETPAFIFCATKAAIKGLDPKQMRQCGTQIILSNTYHLMLQPGGEIIAAMGGLHRFMGWDGPMLTDSGGFQVFSLGHGGVASEIKGKRLNGDRAKTMLKITEEGALFKSYTDGAMHMLTPERSMEVQRQLGADLVVVFDECTPFHVAKSYTERSMHLSHRWADRCLSAFAAHDDGRQALYGIAQGGVYPDLRLQAAEFLNERPFFAHAIGGSLGADKPQMYDVVSQTMAALRRDRPVHLLGIGGIQDIIHGVKQGIDTFDCVHPTRLARHGGALVKPIHWQREGGTPKEHLNLRNQRFATDDRPIDPECPCNTCKQHSRAYLHHLLRAKEPLVLALITAHNVTFMNQLLAAIRQTIKLGNWQALEDEWVI